MSGGTWNCGSRDIQDSPKTSVRRTESTTSTRGARSRPPAYPSIRLQVRWAGGPAKDGTVRDLVMYNILAAEGPTSDVTWSCAWRGTPFADPNRRRALTGPARVQPTRVLGETPCHSELNRLRARAGARSRPPAYSSIRLRV